MPKEKNPTADSIKARLEQLEKDYAEQLEKVMTAEAIVAELYARGTDPRSAIAALNEEEYIARGMRQALTLLDARWYEAARAEHYDAVAAINEGTQRDFLEVKDTLVKKLDEHIRPILEKHGLSGTSLGVFLDSALDSAWVAYSSRSADALRALGSAPPEPPPRDEQGKLAAAKVAV
jgi:hypothetical protein